MQKARQHRVQSFDESLAIDSALINHGPFRMDVISDAEHRKAFLDDADSGSNCGRQLFILGFQEVGEERVFSIDIITDFTISHILRPDWGGS